MSIQILRSFSYHLVSTISYIQNWNVRVVFLSFYLLATISQNDIIFSVSYQHTPSLKVIQFDVIIQVFLKKILAIPDIRVSYGTTFQHEKLTLSHC